MSSKDKGVVEVEVNAMVMELEDSSRIMNLEVPVQDVLLLEERGEEGFCDEGGVGADADVVGDVGCTPTKELSDVVALAPPTVGMVFSSWQEVETYYKAYARQQGFGVVRAAWSGYKAKDKIRQRRNAQWTCDQFDKPDRRRKVNGERRVTDSQIEEDSGVKTSKKCECPLQIYASVNAKNENEWVVRKVVNENQNHNPTPLKSRFIAAHRKEEMNCHVKKKLKLGHSAGLKVAQFHNMLARESNCLHEMAINERDIRNEVYREEKLKLKDGDAKVMLEYFEKITEDTPSLVYVAYNREISQKLGKCKGYNAFKDELLNAIYDSLSVPEFESSWMAVINKYGLEDNVWLDERDMWVLAYTKHLFWEGMKTTQCVKSIHTFFDDYVNKNTTLAEFAEMYCRAMEKKAETERQYDAHSETFIRQIACGFPCESVFQRCYTDMKFKEIQHRVWCRNKETKKEYLTQYKRNYQVRFDMSTKLANCECSLFNHSGIICRHMIKLYDILGEEVPDRYILRRWRKDVSRKHTRVKVAYHDPSKIEHVVTYDEIQLAFEPICSKASVFKDTKQLVLEFLELLDIRVDEKRVMIESEMLNQTPSSVCLKDKQVRTPASTTARERLIVAYQPQKVTNRLRVLGMRAM
ncbi:Protein FAR1-RELATED SEQUENCE 6 [Bienertia sinuspersici]